MRRQVTGGGAKSGLSVAELCGDRAVAYRLGRVVDALEVLAYAGQLHGPLDGRWATHDRYPPLLGAGLGGEHQQQP